MVEHKEFDMELFLSICSKYGLSKEDIFKDINSSDDNTIIISKKTTNMDILKIMYPNIQWDNECNGIIYGFKTDDREIPMLGVNLDWANSSYKKPIQILLDADKSGLDFADMPTV